MRRTGRRLAGSAGTAAATLVVLALTGGEAQAVPSPIDPRGPAARDIAAVWWLMLALGSVVFVTTMALLAAAVLRSRRGAPRRAPLGDNGFIVVAGIAVPAVILLVLMVATVRTGAAVYAPGSQPDVVVEVIGHQFWWEVRYEGEEFVTANEIHIPVGEPVELRLRAADVIHSFWVPQLHGKMDMVPGVTNTFWLQADEPGVYRGLCAEYCGIQHARMHKLVVAQPPEEFQDWLAGQRLPAAQPDDELAARGQEVFLGTSCVHCHAIDGLTPPNDVGPDLTHLASRRTLAAGTLDNNRGNLGGWIMDPQSLKPGSRMPPTSLDGEQLQALLAFLETLE